MAPILVPSPEEDWPSLTVIAVQALPDWGTIAQAGSFLLLCPTHLFGSIWLLALNTFSPTLHNLCYTDTWIVPSTQKGGCLKSSNVLTSCFSPLIWCLECLRPHGHMLSYDATWFLTLSSGKSGHSLLHIQQMQFAFLFCWCWTVGMGLVSTKVISPFFPPPPDSSCCHPQRVVPRAALTEWMGEPWKGARYVHPWQRTPPYKLSGSFHYRCRTPLKECLKN